MLLVSVLWPSLSPGTYLRWRTPTLAALRLLLFALPLNYSVRVLDAMTPAGPPATGPLTWAHAGFNLLMGGCEK